MCILHIEHVCGDSKEHQVHVPHTTLKALHPPVAGLASSNFCIALTSAGAQECRLRTIDGGIDPRDCSGCPECTDVKDLEAEEDELRLLKELDEMARGFKDMKEAEEKLVEGIEGLYRGMGEGGEGEGVWLWGSWMRD